MSLSSEEVRASIALAESTGLLDVPERIRTLASRIDGNATAVAVVGMVKRGKSTLFNRLVGAEVSAVSATPETAATIQVMSGPPAAWGRTKDGSIVKLPSEPSEFMEQLRRSNKNRIISAGITGRFRMPEGLVLVDTPGVGDVATALEDDLASLDAQWMEAGAGAALVVLSAQTQDSKDRALIEKAQRAFPGAVEVVIKPTSRDFTNDEVIEVSEFIENQIGVRVMPMFDITPSGAWGTDEDFAPLETLLVELSKRAEVRLDIDVQRFESFLDELCTELRAADLIELPALMAYPPKAKLPTVLHSTLKATIQRLESEKKIQEEAALRESNATRVAEAELRAQSLIRLYETTSEDWPERISIIEQLAQCTAEGSTQSSKWLERLLAGRDWPNTLTQRRMFLTAAVFGVDPASFDVAVKRATLTADDVDHILRNRPRAQLRRAIEASAASKVAGATSVKLQAIAGVVEDGKYKKEIKALADAALSKEQEAAVLLAISKIQKFSVAELRASRMSLLNMISASDDVLRSSKALSATTRSSLEQSQQQAIAAGWDRLGAAHIRTIQVWFETYPSDKQDADTRLNVILNESGIVAEKISGTPTGTRLEVIRDAARASGPAWTAQVRSKVDRAIAAVDSQQSRLQSIHAVALLGTFLFAFACRKSPMFALASIISFTIACVATAAKGSTGSWQGRMPSIPIPEAITAGGTNAPKHLKLPPLEDNPQKSSKGSSGCLLFSVAVICLMIALVSSIAYSVDRADSEASSRGSYLYSGGSGRSATSLQPMPTNPTTSVPRSSSSTSTSSTTSTTTTSTTRVTRNALADLSSDFAYEPDKCGVDASIKPYPHSRSRTYEVTATIGLWRAPSTDSSRVGIIDVSKYGPGGIGCASGYGPEVTVSCQVEGESITGPFGTDTTWLKVRINGYSGYVTDQWVDTQWDVFTDTIPVCS